MEPTTETTGTRQSAAREESAMHFLAREAKLVFRWGILIFAIVTVLTMITFFFWSILPAAILVLNIVLYFVADFIETRTYREGDPHDETAEDQHRRAGAEAAALPVKEVQKQKISEAVRSRTAKIVAGILVTLTILALILAAIAYGGTELLFLGGFILVAYMFLVSAPVWLGWLNDEAEVEAKRVEQKTTDEQPGGVDEQTSQRAT